jgi:hypothetical protein
MEIAYINDLCFGCSCPSLGSPPAEAACRQRNASASPPSRFIVSPPYISPFPSPSPPKWWIAGVVVGFVVVVGAIVSAVIFRCVRQGSYNRHARAFSGSSPGPVMRPSYAARPAPQPQPASSGHSSTTPVMRPSYAPRSVAPPNPASVPPTVIGPSPSFHDHVSVAQNGDVTISLVGANTPWEGVREQQQRAMDSYGHLDHPIPEVAAFLEPQAPLDEHADYRAEVARLREEVARLQGSPLPDVPPPSYDPGLSHSARSSHHHGQLDLQARRTQAATAMASPSAAPSASQAASMTAITF